MAYTNEKVKELFSEYYEKSLDPSLANIVEKRLRTDTELQSEYKAFISAMQSLGELNQTQVALPTHLNDLIAQRIDLQNYEKRQHAPPKWMILARNMAFAGAASVAVFGAYLSLSHRSNSAIGASALSTTNSNLQFVDSDGILRVEYSPSRPTTVSIYSDPSGALVKTINIASKQHLDAPLVNKNSTASILRIATASQSRVSIVVIPGTAFSFQKKGSGTLEDLAKAISNRYRIPVVLQDPNLTATVEWDFSGSDLLSNIQPSLATINYSADKRNGDVVYITKSS